MKLPQNNDWILRPATLADIDDVCEIINAHSLAILGTANDAKRGVEMTWGQPKFEMETDTRVAITPEGRIAGGAGVSDTREPHVQLRSWMCVHPEFQHLGLDARLLAWTEKRASEAIAKAPDGARVSVSQDVENKDARAQKLLEDSGYSVIRHFWEMTIELANEIPEPIWPEGVRVRTFVFEEDLEATVHAFRDSFQDHWGHIDMPFEEELKQWDYWIRNDKEFDPALTFLAVAGDEIVGLSSCDPKSSEDPAMGYVDVLGVTRTWRRRGIALALLHHSFNEFKKRGQQRVGLGVDATSLTGANRLYEAAGMKPTRQFGAFEKELRAGVELGLQSLGTGENSS